MKRKQTFPEYITKALETLMPPEDISVSQWAEKYRLLEEKSSHMPGRWRNSVTPYLIGIMDELTNYETELVVFCKPTQVGGTECIFNALGYIIDQDPAPTMIVYPIDKLGEATSENRIIPMIETCPQLKRRYDERASSRLELRFDGMYIAISGANSPSSLSSRPIRFLFLDEVDKYPASSKKEADPISLAKERTKTFPNRKIYMCSTPTLRSGAIWKNKEDADIEKHFFIPCPHCGSFIELLFKQIIWPGKDSGLTEKERADYAHYICQECGCVITDSEKAQAMQSGEWRIVRQNTKYSRSVAFWLNTLYSPFTRFTEIAKEFMDSKDDPDALRNFTNSWLGEPWEEAKQRTSAEDVLTRQTDTEQFIVPEFAKIITAGIDVQENCLYWTIRAFGDYFTSQNIAHGQAFSFGEVERIMNLEFKKESGAKLMVALALIDSGDRTDEVYDFAAQNSEWCLPCKGTSTMMSHYKLSTVNKSSSKAYGMNLVLVDGGKYKDMIAARMRKPNGTGSWMVYKDIDLEYCEQVTAEQKNLVRNSKGQEEYRWEPKTSHADNHYLDAEVYAMTAADIMGVRTLHLQEKVQEPKEEAAEQQNQSEQFNENGWLSGGSWL